MNYLVSTNHWHAEVSGLFEARFLAQNLEKAGIPVKIFPLKHGKPLAAVEDAQ